MQAARSDAVGALFVFLHLLEGNAQFVGEGGLAEAELQAPDANARANENIGLCRAMFHMAFLSALGFTLRLYYLISAQLAIR